MNSKEYIESGLLESYVLGLTSDEEKLEIERMVSLHPEIAEEIRAIETALNTYAEKFQRTPPEHLKSKIWTKINEDDVVDQKVPEWSQAETKIRPIGRRYSINKYLVAASITLLIGSSILNVFLYKEWKQTNQELSALNQEKESLASEFQVQQSSYSKLKGDLAFIGLPTTKAISLKGVEKFPDAYATIFFNATTQEVVLNLTANSLPMADPNQQYQLWAIVDGKPVDVGVFDGTSENSAFLKMKKITGAQAFAITLEKRGGSPTPHLEAMYVIGNV